jgi:N6-adenosine-specific RNA methylase IME4/anti-sigma28 factor (negative regulator of flagellin synthesis)|tara:strand:+ start:725 stop:1852 length:1128 start_codon:yes stop_codon:yes gene_type:complete
MIKIKKEFKSLIPDLTKEEYKQLEQNCLDEGIREKILVWNGFIIDGHNRYEISLKWNLEIKTETKHFKDEEAVKEWMILNQFGRRNLSNYQRSILALQLEEVFSKKAKENLGRNQYSSLANLPNTKINTRQELSKVAQVGERTLGMVKKIQEKATEEVKAKLSTGEVSINSAYQDIKKEENKKNRLAKIEQIKQEISKGLKTPNGLYDVISIDPPWEYSERGGSSHNSFDAVGNRAGVDYPTMTVEELKKINIPAKSDCVMFLWTTHAFLKDSFDLLNAWEFNYKATLVWDKVKMGMGRNIRMQVEFCLLATKGKPILDGSGERDIITEPRREHSRKPESFYTKVDNMTVGYKLDYFAREQRKNWFTYGAEVGKF